MKNVKCSLLYRTLPGHRRSMQSMLRYAGHLTRHRKTPRQPRFPNLPPYRPQVSTWAAIFISTVRRGAAMRRSAVRLFPNSILVWLSGEPRKRTLMSCFPLFLKKGSLSRPRNSNSMLVSAVRAVVRSIFTP